MNIEAATTDYSTGARDREVIRVENPCAHMDITGALRRAFAEAAYDRCDHDFEALLRKLN